MFANLTTVQAHIKSGKVRALAISTARRSLVVPELPGTVAEAGVPGYEANNWNGVVVPAGTPRVAIERLQREIKAIVTAPTCAQPNCSRPRSSRLLIRLSEFARYLASERTPSGRRSSRTPGSSPNDRAPASHSFAFAESDKIDCGQGWALLRGLYS